MDQHQIKAFIDAMAASDLDEMEISHDGWTLRLMRHGRGVVAVAPVNVLTVEIVNVPLPPLTSPPVPAIPPLPLKV